MPEAGADVAHFPFGPRGSHGVSVAGELYRGLAAASACTWFASLSENTCVVLFHTRRISSRLLMVFDFSSSICRFASAPAVPTSPFTRLCSAWIQASRPLALGWRVARLGLTVASPGVEAVWAIRRGLPSDDRLGSGALTDGRPGQARGGELLWVGRAGSGAVAGGLVGAGDATISGRRGAGGVMSGRGADAVSAGTLTDSGRAGGAGSGFADRRLDCSEALDCGLGGGLTTSVGVRAVSRGLPMRSTGGRDGLGGAGASTTDSACGSMGGSGVRSEVGNATSRARFTSAFPADIWAKRTTSTLTALTAPTIAETRATSGPTRTLLRRLNSSRMRWSSRSSASASLPADRWSTRRSIPG